MKTTYCAVYLSDNPGPFVSEDGPQKGFVVTESDESLIPNEFGMACNELFGIGYNIRISKAVPFLEDFHPDKMRSAKVGNRVFWTNCGLDDFARLS